MKNSEFNKRLSEFLIDHRVHAGMSQSDVAERSSLLGVGRTLDQRAVSRIEKNPISADFLKLTGYLVAVGVEPGKAYELISNLLFKQETNAMEANVFDTVQHSINKALKKVDEVDNGLANLDKNIVSKDLLSKIDSARISVKALNRKPIVAFFGAFDAGKSTAINTVIAENALPASYQPATSVINLLIHTSERPEALSNKVAVFGKGFMPHMINDPVLVSKYLIEQGDLELLERSGTHEYNEKVEKSQVHMVVVFSNAPILEKIWLLDTPGDLNNEDTDDTALALSGVDFADAIVFVSAHAGFMKQTDLGFAANVIRQKPPLNPEHPLEHIVFIQSHCHDSISDEEVKRVKDVAFNRTLKQWNDLVFEHWKADGKLTVSPSADDLSSCIQPFWREVEEYRDGTLRRINELSDYLVDNQERIVKQATEKALTHLKAVLEAEIASLESKKRSSDERVKELETQDNRFRERSNELIRQFKELIKSCETRKQQDKKDVKAYYDSITNTSSLSQIIKDTYKGDKKQAQSEIGEYLSQLFTSKLEKSLKMSGKEISNEIDELLESWQDIAPNIDNLAGHELPGLEHKLDLSAFNAKAAFVGGLSGLTGLGAMAMYVSTIASNLGAYILVGKAAGVLVSLGLAGSVTSVTSFVAAIGGPITIGIALAGAIALIAYKLFSSATWEESLADKVIKALKKEGAWENMESTITKFWDETASAIKAGLEELIEQTDEYIDNLWREARQEFNTDELDAQAEKLESVLERI